MPRRPKKRRRGLRRGTWLQRAVTWVKRHPRSSVMYVLIFLGALVPAWKGVEFIDNMTDDWQFARHPFVRDQVGVVDKKAASIGLNNTAILRDVQTDINNIAKRIATADKRKWKDELDNPNLDKTQREDAQQRYDDATKTLDSLTAQAGSVKVQKLIGQ